jgi:L-arabinose 1-dehydrogenase
MLRVAMLGLGVISRYYLAAIDRVPDVELVAACDLDPARLEPLGRRGAACERDWRAAVAREDVDAVLVNLPNDMHAEVCLEALAAGRHVCCEKPLALSEADARAIDSMSRERGRTLLTAFHRRYNRNLVRVVDSLRGRRVASASARYWERIEDHAGSDTWYLDPERCGGGCLADNGPNAFDALRHALGPLELTGCALVRDGRGVDVRAVVRLSAAGGAVPATVELDWGYEGEVKDVTLETVDGERLEADMLAGFDGFKSSLYHEYVAVLRDFVARAGRGERGDQAGVDAARLVEQAYGMAMVPAS